MNRQRTATILHLPHDRARAALWRQVAHQLGVPHEASAIARRPWGWLNAHARRLKTGTA